MLSLLCEIFSNMCITIVYKPGCDITNFEIKPNLSNQVISLPYFMYDFSRIMFLIKLFLYDVLCMIFQQ